MAKLKKSQRELNKTATGVEVEIPTVKITRPSLPAHDNTKKAEKKSQKEPDVS